MRNPYSGLEQLAAAQTPRCGARRCRLNGAGLRCPTGGDWTGRKTRNLYTRDLAGPRFRKTLQNDGTLLSRIDRYATALAPAGIECDANELDGARERVAKITSRRRVGGLRNLLPMSLQCYAAG